MEVLYHLFGQGWKRKNEQFSMTSQNKLMCNEVIIQAIVQRFSLEDQLNSILQLQLVYKLSKAIDFNLV